MTSADRVVTWLFVITLVALSVAEAKRGGRRRGNKQGSSDAADPNCSDWSTEGHECVPVKGTCGKGRIQVTREGEDCEVKERMQKCRVPCGDKKGKGKGKRGCRYQKSDWSECNVDTNEQTRTLTLEPGSKAEGCEQTKTVSRRCRNGNCKYSRGDWSACIDDKVTRTLTLRNGDDTCEQTMTEEQTCEKAAKMADRKAQRKQNRKDKRQQKRQRRRKNRGCKYSMNGRQWSDCVDNVRTIEQTLISSNSQADCPPSRTITRNCTNKKGVESCFFGEWSDFGSCVDGVQTKTRDLQFGPERCQRRVKSTKKTKKCQAEQTN